MPAAVIIAAVSIGASAAASAGIISATLAMVITIAASVGGALLMKTSVPSIGAYTGQQERKQILRSSTAPMAFVYGCTVVSGLLFFAEEQAGSQDKNEWVHLAIALTGHPIDRIGNIWLGDDLIGTYGDNVTYQIHNNRDTPDPFMLSNCPSWKEDMVGKGICWARVSLKYDQDKFPAGIPNIKFEVYGKHVLDPRSGLTLWTDNAALCIMDYYRTYLGVPDSDINTAQFIQAANISDQDLNDGGGYRKRYTINGVFDAGETQSGVLDDMHLACAGEPTYMAGQHGLLVGAYYGPATMDIMPGQIISDVKIIPEAAYGDKINIVTGTFLDAQAQYAETDYPAVKVDQYIIDDGAEFRTDLKLRFVSNEFQAQQLAQIKIARTRIGRTLTFTMNLSGYMYRPGYYVNLYLPQLGINGVEFRITEWAISADNGVDITLKQETAAVWGDAIGSPIDRDDITDFPAGGAAQPITLVFTVEEIGEVVQGVFSWTNVDLVAYNIVVIRQNGVVLQTIQVPGTSVNINGLPRGEYQFAVIAVNNFGQRSAEGLLIVEIQAPSPPSGVTITQQYFGFTLKPRTTDLYNVSTQYDFWTSGLTALPDTSEATVTTQATRRGMGQMITDSGLQNDTVYYWYIRAINAYGTSAFIEVAALCKTDTSGLLDYIDEAVRDSGAFQGLQDGIDTNVEGILSNANANNDTVFRQFRQQGELSAQVITISSTVVDNEKAIAEMYDLVMAELGPDGEIQAAINQKLTAVVNSDTTASATYLLNLMVKRFGQEYNAGFGISIDDVGGGVYKSSMVIDANRFAVYSTDNFGNKKNLFSIFDGQAYLDTVFIKAASIDFAKITDTIQSDNYVANVSGWKLSKNGTFEINGSNGNGRVLINNTTVLVYDNNGRLRVRMGLWG